MNATTALTAELFDFARAIAEAALDAAGVDGTTKQQVFLRDLNFSRKRKTAVSEMVEKIKKGQTK